MTTKLKEKVEKIENNLEFTLTIKNEQTGDEIVTYQSGILQDVINQFERFKEEEIKEYINNYYL